MRIDEAPRHSGSAVPPDDGSYLVHRTVSHIRVEIASGKLAEAIRKGFRQHRHRDECRAD